MPTSDRKLCFVIGPIGSPGSDTRRHADWLLRGIIKPVFKEHFPEYDVIRADEIVAPGNINSQIINRLWDAPLVIADMSLHNANAFYELAIRHMNGLPTIHMIRQADEIPFDNSPYRAIKFSYAEPTDIDVAQTELKSVVEEVIKPDFSAENPITHARGYLELKENATAPQKVLLDAVAEMERRLSSLERKPSNIRIRADDVAAVKDSIALRADGAGDSSPASSSQRPMDEILASIRKIIAADDAANK